MITIEQLRTFGANTDEGLKRFMNMTEFYIKMVTKALSDNAAKKLAEAVNAKDYDKAFELAHAMKGVYGNLSLTPIYVPVCQITEHLRKKEDMDYSELVKVICDKTAELEAML